MQLRDLMTKDPACCTPDTPLPEVARMMVEHDCGALPVVVDTKPVGVITDRDIVARALATGRDPLAMSAGDCMTSPAVTIDDEAHLDECLEMLELGRIRRAIVVDREGCCIGIVTQADIALHGSKREIGRLVHEVSKREEPVFTSRLV
jgi:CBS domain-containing protein